jgi:hypothetical protein
MAWGRRCDLGCASWPDELIYGKCLDCGEPTTRYSNLTPMDADEAKSAFSHAQFEEYYARRCRLRGIPESGPLPDEPAALLTG